MRRSCFPNSSSHQHGPPLLGRVRMPLRSPTSALLCSPPTPSSPSAAAPVSPRQRPTSVRRNLFFAATPVPTPTRATSEISSTPAPRQPALSQGETRVSQVPGPSSSCVPWSKTPPGATAPRPLSVRSPSSSGEVKPWTPGKTNHFVATYPRPTRSRAYASPNPLPSPAQGSLPARAGSPLAGRVSHPLDDKTRFHEVIAYSTPPRPALPGRTTSGLSGHRVAPCACRISLRRQTENYAGRTFTCKCNS